MTITSLFSRALLALALATGAGAASAVPTAYHIDIDTSTLAGPGYLDLTFIGFGFSGAATAVVSQFTGAASGAAELDGTVTGDLGSTAVFTGSGNNYLEQLVQFGGMFGFDVLFDYASAGGPTQFAVTLYDLGYTTLTGSDVATFNLVPGDGIVVGTNALLVSATEISAAVPEPGQWLLMATGLVLLGAMARRRNA